MIFNIDVVNFYRGTLLITAPANVTVTVSKGDDTKTKIADENGEAFFYGLDAGAWEVTITDGEEIETKLIQITTDFECILSFFNATISVTYPSGSICTCTNGDTVLTAPDTTGNATFAIHEAGEWTVNCTDGDATKSQIVTITENGQSETVTLHYELYLYNLGDIAEVSGGWSGRGVSWNDYYVAAPNVTNNGTSITLSLGYIQGNGACGVYEANNGIDVTDFNSLEINITNINTTGIRFWISIYNPGIKNWDGCLIAETQINGAGKTVLDISSVTGSVCIGIRVANMYSATSGSCTFNSVRIS